jgi:hypothetical protein
MLNHEKLSRLVIGRLGGYVGRNDIIFEVCQAGDLNWSQATALVDQVEKVYCFQIAAHQRRLLVFICLQAVIEGLCLLVISAFTALSMIGDLFGPTLWLVKACLIVILPATFFFVIWLALMGTSRITGGMDSLQAICDEWLEDGSSATWGGTSK